MATSRQIVGCTHKKAYRHGKTVGWRPRRFGFLLPLSAQSANYWISRSDTPNMVMTPKMKIYNGNDTELR